jgi:hypothetical protein
MKVYYFPIFAFVLFISNLSSQSPCSNSTWIEKDGLARVEMENHPSLNGWKTSNAVPGHTGGGYIFWDGTPYFSNSTNGKITYKIKINTPGKYLFDWSVAVGFGNVSTEHNDSWLSITNVDNFYANKATTNTNLQPKPQCNGNVSYGCPNGNSVGGYFKIYGGRVQAFQWQAHTSDNDPHLVYFDVSTPRTIEVNIAARSSYQLLDKFVIYQPTLHSSSSIRQSNIVSDCSASVNTNNLKDEIKLKLYPNPVLNDLNIESSSEFNEYHIYNVVGNLIDNNKIPNLKNIPVSQLPQGMYYLHLKNNSVTKIESFVKK